MKRAPAIHVKRIYDPPMESDGLRILIDRIWPRGIKREDAQLDDWLKDLAPSTELRTWFSHDATKWEAFQKRYFAELDEQAELCSELANRARRGTVTLLYAARDESHNNAVALREYLTGQPAE